MADEIKKVTNTEILVARNKEEQLTVYSNKTLNYKSNNYMILPIPCSMEHVRFIDLTDVDVFETLDDLFRIVSKSYSFGYDTFNVEDVKYHSVGSYDVYTCASILAINKVANIDQEIIKLLEKYYKDYSFLMCKLKNDENYKYHPLGYIHKIVNNSVFIPTRHLHIHFKGDLYEKDIEEWDHNIYVYNYGNYQNTSYYNYNNSNKLTFKNLGDQGIQRFKRQDLRITNQKLPKIDFNYDTVKNVTKFSISGLLTNDDLLVLE